MVTAKAFQVLRIVLHQYPINIVRAVYTRGVLSAHDDEDTQQIEPHLERYIRIDFERDSEKPQVYEGL